MRVPPIRSIRTHVRAVFCYRLRKLAAGMSVATATLQSGFRRRSKEVMEEVRAEVPDRSDKLVREEHLMRCPASFLLST